MPMIEKPDGAFYYKPSLKLRLMSYGLFLGPLFIFAAFAWMQYQLASLKMENQNLQKQLSVCEVK